MVALACGVTASDCTSDTDRSPAPRERLPKYGVHEQASVVALSRDHDYMRTHEAPDFWALTPYYVGQDSGSACSVASVAMLVNALARAGRELSDDDQNATQVELRAKVASEHWRARTSFLGYWGHYGLTLAQLRTVTEESLRSYVASPFVVEAVEADDAPGGLEKLREVLTANEGSAADVMLVHFLQDLVTGAPGGPYPHISPVGAYDAERDRVLVMDVDRDWYEPYWVSTPVLWHAMATPTSTFGPGGFVRARRLAP